MSAPANTPTPSDRVLLWRWLAATFTYPDAEIWQWLTTPGFALPTPTAPTLDEQCATFLAIFGHTVRGDCPPHELEYGELKADALYQPHRLADIAAFYSAFGLEIVPEMADRVDHIAMECEFYAVLCAKEEVAAENLDLCRDAQKKFLREHLARWTPAFSRRLARLAGDPFYRAVADILHRAILAECDRHHLRPGNADLHLRPVEEMVDVCGSCGISGAAFPGGGQDGE
ncbi:MAG: Chaperone protein TorD [Verrucomicrobiae bacterium]|nr:Chaperone protein TorD [Verrucomicrobiae bacterium]